MPQTWSVSFEQFSQKETLERYRENGFVLVKQVLPKATIQANVEAFSELLRLRLRAVGQKIAVGENDIDALYNILSKVDPESRFEFRRVLLEHAAFYEFLVHPNMQAVAKSLLGTNQVHINHQMSIVRVDSPFQDAESFHWHQDYPYNIMSRSAVTIWAPLTPINREMGYLKLVPGSHTHLLPVELNEHGTVANFTQHKRLRIWNEESQVADFERQAIDADSVEPGDVLFFHSHLLHRSGQNNSDRARWVFNSRLGDIADAEVVGRRWRCARFRDLWPVKDIHPEKVHLAS